jgi:polyisoprenyl-teichoic acid--peptidoglycan teichoic acid transferase
VEEADEVRPGRRMLVRSVLAALAIALLTAGASATAVLLEVDRLVDPPGEARVPIPSTHIATTAPGEPQTLLLLGSDARWHDGDDDPPRSDTIMLVRLDPAQGATTVLSVPRDLRARIPGHGVRRINDAYSRGGPELTLRTVKDLTGLEIHHVANVNFGGFRRIVNLFGCFYVDVDRRYFHSNEGVPPGQRWAAIDVKPGYQRLCGNDALAYVRHRHTDSDIVRSHRQQDFLRAAKDQMSTSALIDDRSALAGALGRYVDTDRSLRSAGGFLRVMKLALQAADLPIRHVPFPADEVEGEEGGYLETSPAAVGDAVARFLEGGGPAARAPARPPRRRGSVRDAGLVEARGPARRLLAAAGRRAGDLDFPIRFPSHRTPRSSYEGPLRLYPLRDRAGSEHRAYRFVLRESRVGGQYYGVQGTSWRNPPLLAHPSAVRTVRGRRLELFRAGSRLRFVAWRTDRAAYWISNTLSLKLSNDQMLALAASLTTE